MSPEAERLVIAAAASAKHDADDLDAVIVSRSARAALAAHIEALERDAARYRWLKLFSSPGQPFGIHEQMRAAKRLLEAYELFCRPHGKWDNLIDDAMQRDEASPADCPDALLPDGPVCPRCGGRRGESGIDGGSWVHVRRAEKEGNRG